MNRELMEHIAHHILVNLGALSASFLDYKKTQPIIASEFLLDQKILFKNEKDEIIKNPVYACQVNIEQKTFKIILGVCDQDSDILEYCVVVQFEGNPAYGLYLVCNPSVDSEALIAVSANDKDWMPCSTFLQATFLAAMEQLKDIGLGWIKCTDYKKQYEMLLSMISFHEAYYEVENEGKEN